MSESESDLIALSFSLMVALRLLLVATFAAAASAWSPPDPRDCGKGITCYPCLSKEANPKEHTTAATAAASAAVSACDPSSYANATCSSNRKHRVAALANIATPAACCSACSSNARCKAWTHYGSTKCNLFSTGDGPHSGPCVSGGVTPPTPPTPVPPAGAICKDCPNIILMITVRYKGNDARQREKRERKRE